MLNLAKKRVLRLQRVDVQSPIDSLGMGKALLDLPRQIERSFDESKKISGLPDAAKVDQVVILGMGGSGIAGDIVKAIATPLARIPIIVSKGYECPTFVSSRTFVVAASFSGDTEETLEAAGAASERGAQIMAVTCGGKLQGAAENWDGSIHLVDSLIPMPRCAVAAMSLPVLVAMDLIGLIPDVETEVQGLLQTVRERCNSIRDGLDTYRSVAQKIGNKTPLIYGGGDLGQVAATRLKNQINENAKIPAFSNVLPELCHNEMAGWGSPSEMATANMEAVHLRHDYEHPRLAARFDFNESVALTDRVEVTTVNAQGPSALAQLFDLIVIGDQISLELAALHSQDPGPIDILAQLKQELAK